MNNFGKAAGVAFGIALSFAACGSDSDDETQTRVTVDPATAQAALTELTTSVDTTVTGYSTSNDGAAPAGETGTAATLPSVSITPTGGGGSLSVQCAAGGAADVSGYVNVVPVPVNVDVNVAIDYNACQTNTGTTLLGTIDFSQKVAAGGGGPVQVETIYQGDVQFSGKVQASCPIDLRVMVDQSGRSTQVSGMFCNQDASTLNLQIEPRWGG